MKTPQISKLDVHHINNALRQLDARVLSGSGTVTRVVQPSLIAGPKGDKGDPGTSTPIEYDKRSAYHSEYPFFLYSGTAQPGELEVNYSWRVSRYNFEDESLEYADGNTDFDNIWNDRESLSYAPL